MKKKKEHDHDLFPSQVFELVDYQFIIVKIECSDENCDFLTWDYGTELERP